MSDKKYEINKHIDSYDNEGFVPDSINFYGIERKNSDNDTFAVYKKSRRIK